MRQFNLYEITKRLFDICLSSVGIVIFFPFFIIIGLLIVLDSKGPILYCGVRAGRLGKPFAMYKFRTMIVDSESTWDTTALNDPRITKVGSILRKYKLDELPQLINVFKGQMSFVGPRPELIEYTQLYTANERCILDAKPGITDLSSLKFHSLDSHVGAKDARLVFETSVLPVKNRLRVQYSRERSFLLDIKILFRTFILIIKKLLWIMCY